MRAQRYGTIPIARRVRDLADTIEDGASRFLFNDYSRGRTKAIDVIDLASPRRRIGCLPSAPGLGCFFYTMWSRVRPVGSQTREAKGERF